MRPDPSVLLLTTLIGVGQGLFLALFTVQLYAFAGLLPPQDGHAFYAYGSLIALFFLIAGLIASFFHLGRPERAWRAAAKWRTSWLSREVIVLPAFMGAVFLFGVAHLVGFRPIFWTLPSGVAIDATVVLGGVATILAFALFERGRARPDSVPGRMGDHPYAARIREPRGVTRAQPSLGAEIHAADRGRDQAPADRPEIDGIHGRVVQHSRVLPSQNDIGPAVGQMDLPARRFRRPAGAARGRMAPRGNAGVARGVWRPIRRSPCRAMALFRASKSSPEPLLPGRRMTLTWIKFFLPQRSMVIKLLRWGIWRQRAGLLRPARRAHCIGGIHHAAR